MIIEEKDISLHLATINGAEENLETFATHSGKQRTSIDSYTGKYKSIILTSYSRVLTKIICSRVEWIRFLNITSKLILKQINEG